MRRHAVLRQCLPVSRATLQLVQLHLGGAARPAAQSRRDGPRGRGDGEVHDVPSAHHRRQDSGAGGWTRGEGRRHADRLSADLPHPSDHLRQPEGRGRRNLEALSVPARLSRARRDRHPVQRDLPQEGGARGAGRVGSPGGRGAPRVSAPPVGSGQATWADVNRDVDRTLLNAGNTYFAWMTLIALILGCGVAAWGWQIATGLGVAGIRTPQMWALYITNFVFWIGIGHAGTLISAILYLFRAKWRT